MPISRDLPEETVFVVEGAVSYKPGDIIWAQLDGYPFWPGMVCDDPDKAICERPGEIHIQFFDKRPSRAWVKRRYWSYEY